MEREYIAEVEGDLDEEVRVRVRVGPNLPVASRAGMSANPNPNPDQVLRATLAAGVDTTEDGEALVVEP